MIIYNKIEQQSEEWYEIKKLKMSASNAQAIGNNGKGLNTYIKKIVMESITGRDEYTNKDIDRGNELEPLARFLYELETGRKVEQVGFIGYNDYCGCSPDGIIKEGDNIIGGIEIKALNNANHFDLLLDFKIESKYFWQIQMTLMITGAKWWDYICYNPNFKKSLLVKRVYPEKTNIEKLKEGIKTGEKMIKELTKNDNIKYELESIKNKQGSQASDPDGDLQF